MKSLSAVLGVLTTPVLSCVGTIAPAEAGTECGVAAYYNQGSITANGEGFDPDKLTAAHPWLPFGTWITVVDQDTGLSIDVRINDRGPWDGARILDMTPAAIDAIDPNQTSDLRYICLHW